MLSDEEVARVLHDTREYIEDHGWVRGTMRSRSGKVCVNGGIIYSQGWMGLGESIIYTRLTDLAQCDAMVMRVVPREGRSWFASVPDWNDDYYTTEQEVLDVLGKAEKVALGVSPADV